MSIRPPQRYQPKPESVQSALDYEIAQEKASTLGRRLEAAITALAQFDSQNIGELADAQRAHRRGLVGDAGKALWLFVVQRESIGLRDSARLLRDYKVPDEVRDRMGAF